MNFNINYITKDNSNIKNILNNKIFLNRKIFLENNILKTQIDDIPYHNWKIIRSICSDYEIVGNNKIHQNYKIKEIISISRAYFKLLEVLNIYEKIIDIKNKKNKLSINCLCEEPSRFIKCLYDYRCNENDIYKTISLKNDKTNLIEWNIKNIKNLEIIYGNKKKHDGNIFNPEIINAYIQKHDEKVDLVTADGGMLLQTFQENYKSNYHIHLFLSELYIASKILNKSGVFILKVYDLSPKVMVDFLIILNNMFGNVRIIKPKTSREMNNEKYIVCKSLNQNIGYIQKNIWNILKHLWNNKNDLLINILSKDTINNHKNLIDIFKRIDLNNLIIQNKKLKYAIELKKLRVFELKSILKNKKSFHFKNAYKWFKLNNIEIN